MQRFWVIVFHTVGVQAMSFCYLPVFFASSPPNLQAKHPDLTVFPTPLDPLPWDQGHHLGTLEIQVVLHCLLHHGLQLSLLAREAVAG